MDERRETTTEGGKPAGGAGDSGSVARELQELGRQLTATARAAWESEQRRQIQQELADGLQSLRDQLSEAVESARSHPRAQNVTQSVKEQAGKVAETTRVGDVADDVRGGIATGLRELNEQLRRLRERFERGDGEPAATTGGGISATPVVTHTENAVQAAPPSVTPPAAASGTGAGVAGASAGESTIMGAGLTAEEPALAPETAGDDRPTSQSPGSGLPEAPEGPEGRPTA